MSNAETKDNPKVGNEQENSEVFIPYTFSFTSDKSKHHIIDKKHWKDMDVWGFTVVTDKEGQRMLFLFKASAETIIIPPKNKRYGVKTMAKKWQIDPPIDYLTGLREHPNETLMVSKNDGDVLKSFIGEGLHGQIEGLKHHSESILSVLKKFFHEEHKVRAKQEISGNPSYFEAYETAVFEHIKSLKLN